MKWLSTKQRGTTDNPTKKIKWNQLTWKGGRTRGEREQRTNGTIGKQIVKS